MKQFGVLLGDRASASPLRAQVEQSLARQEPVELDFGGVEAVTQSFADELIGAPLRKMGMSHLSRFAFRNCGEGIKAVIRFVVAYSQKHTSQAV